MLLTKELIESKNLPIIQEKSGGYRFLESICFIDDNRVLIGDEAEEWKLIIMHLILDSLKRNEN